MRRNKKIPALIFYLLLLPAGLSAQTLGAAAGDAFGNVYFTENRTEIVRTDSTGKETGRLSLRGNGGFIDRISIGAALGPAVFGSGNRELILLDRFMAEESRFNFNGSEVQMPVTALLASDNSVWAADGADLSLKKMQAGGQLLLKIDLLQFVENEGFDLTALQESNGNVALPEGEEIVIWDRFGNFSSRFAAGRPFVFADRHLYFVRAGRLLVYDLSGREISGTDLPENFFPADCMAAAAGNIWFFIGKQRLKISLPIR